MEQQMRHTTSCCKLVVNFTTVEPRAPLQLHD